MPALLTSSVKSLRELEEALAFLRRASREVAQKTIMFTVPYIVVWRLASHLNMFSKLFGESSYPHFIPRNQYFLHLESSKKRLASLAGRTRKK